MRTIIIKKGKTIIDSVNQWKKEAPPEGGDKQWVDEHSAKELAKYCVHYKPCVPKEIDDFLNEINISQEPFLSEPERITSLCKEGFGKNGPRHHDLLMWNNQIVVGIEAKATEALDEYVTEKCKREGVVQYSENQLKRYPGLCNAILGKNIEECKNIRYQLLSATAGTLIEAKKKKLEKCALIILLFKTKLVTEEHIASTRKDVSNFINSLRTNNDGSLSALNFLKDIHLYLKLIEVDPNTYK